MMGMVTASCASVRVLLAATTGPGWQLSSIALATFDGDSACLAHQRSGHSDGILGGDGL